MKLNAGWLKVYLVCWWVLWQNVILYWEVVQSAEHRTLDAGVIGSSPIFPVWNNGIPHRATVGDFVFSPTLTWVCKGLDNRYCAVTS